jgi:hypothetical protein
MIKSKIGFRQVQARMIAETAVATSVEIAKGLGAMIGATIGVMIGEITGATIGTEIDKTIDGMIVGTIAVKTGSVLHGIQDTGKSVGHSFAVAICFHLSA